MKRLTNIVILLLTPLAYAQNYQNMSEQDMQKMMQQAQEMQACMQNVDQSRLQTLSNEAKQVESEIKALCSSGKHNKAEQKALKFGQEINSDPDIAAIRKCGEMMRGVMPQMGFIDRSATENSGGHVCDGM